MIVGDSIYFFEFLSHENKSCYCKQLKLDFNNTRKPESF